MSKTRVLFINWLLIVLVPIFITACVTTSTPTKTPDEQLSQVYFTDGSKPLLHAKLGKLQIKPVTREVVTAPHLTTVSDRKLADAELRKGLSILLNSSGLFESSTGESINVSAVPVSLSAPVINFLSQACEFAVEYAFRAEDGTLLFEEKIVALGKESRYPEDLKTAISSNVTQLSYAIKKKLPAAWNSYVGKRDATRRQISINLRKENRYFRVITSKAVVRDSPNAQAREISILPQGDLVYVTGSLPSGWMQVSREGQPIGWIHSTLLREDFTSVPNDQPEVPPKISVPVLKTASIPIDMTAPLLDFGSYHALIVGNNDYKYLPRLNTAVNDAQELASLLRDLYGFNVKILKNGTRADILRTINGYRRTLTNRDNLLIYYAGHGWLDKDADQGYWLPVDAEEQDSTNWISNSSITDSLRAMDAKHVLVIADSCYSGKLARGLNIRIRTKNYYQKISGKKARTVMASGGLEPVADDGGKMKHSVFASALIDALNENTGILDATYLFNKIRRPVMVNADQTPEYSLSSGWTQSRKVSYVSSVPKGSPKIR